VVLPSFSLPFSPNFPFLFFANFVYGVSSTLPPAVAAPKRKRPRLVKYDEDSRPASPAKPELAESSSRPEAASAARSEGKTSTSAAAESGSSAAPAAAQLETSRDPEKIEDRGRSRDPELRPSESDRRDHRPESRTEPPAAPSGKPDGEATPVGSEARNGEATATTKMWASWIFILLVLR
jgi:hypothetical protein